MRSEAWRPAAAACNRSSREARDPARQALRPGCEELAARIRRQLPAVVGRRATKGAEARPRGQKPPRWSAERRASRVMGRKAPRKRLAYRVMIRPTGVPPSTRTSLGAPPTSFRVSEATMQTPGAENAPRERNGLFEIVRWNNGERFSDEPQFRHALIRPHPEERACGRSAASSNAACAHLEG